MAWLSNLFSFIANSKPVQILLAVLGAVFAFKAVQMKARMDGEEAQRKKHNLEAARERASTLEARHEITLENQNASVRADEAVAALPRLDSLEQLRQHAPAVADELLGKPSQGSAGGAKSR